jgi:hypothetical protein
MRDEGCEPLAEVRPEGAGGGRVPAAHRRHRRHARGEEEPNPHRTIHPHPILSTCACFYYLFTSFSHSATAYAALRGLGFCLFCLTLVFFAFVSVYASCVCVDRRTLGAPYPPEAYKRKLQEVHGGAVCAR